MKVAVVVLEGMYATSVAVTLDVLDAAAALAMRTPGAPEVSRVVVGRAEQVALSGGMWTRPEASWEEVEDADVVVMPGLGIATPSRMDARLGSEDIRALSPWLSRMQARGAMIAASCASVFVLAQAGCVACGPVTTTWWLAEVFRARFPEVALEPERVVTAGAGWMCAGAAMAQADLMQALVARWCGEEVADGVSRYLLLETRELQPRYALSGVHAARHPEVARARDWVLARAGEQFTVGDLARGLGMSARTLARRLEAGAGASPSKFIQGVRAERAAHLLRTTQESVAEIARLVGYDDATSLRRATKARFGRTPHQLRTSR